MIGKMTKQAFSLLAVGALLLGLAGCGAQQSKTAETAASAVETTASAAETTTAAAETTTAGSTSAKAAMAETVEINVSAAASLTDAAAKLAEAFVKQHPEIKLVYNFGSSGKLQQQIEEGAPADLFLSAGQKQMNALAEKKLIDSDSRVDLLKNEVVLIVPADSSLELSSFEDVVKDDVKMIAIGEASVPVGQYTEEIFTYLGLWDQVQAKANFGQDVRNVLAWVEEGQADCGVVYATDAAITEKVKVVAVAPEGSHKPVVYPAAVIKTAEHPSEAQTFLDFLKTPEATAIFEQYGFKSAQP